jgi:hypothetical protein
VYGDSAGKQATDFPSARKSWSVTFIKDTTIADSLQRPPQAGDVFHIATTKPFRTGEYFSFTTVAPRFDPAQAKTDLNRISVVPNPYVGAPSGFTPSADTWFRRSSTTGRSGMARKRGT